MERNYLAFRMVYVHVSVFLLPPLGEGWDGGAEIALDTPVDSSLALAISAGFQPWVNPAQAPIPPSPKGGKEQNRD